MTSGTTAAERLEQGELLLYPPGEFPLPTADDLDFLRSRRLRQDTEKAIALDTSSGKVSGERPTTPEESERLAAILGRFAGTVAEWLAERLPEYAEFWQPDRATLRTEEEAIRHLRHDARDDLLHVDHFPDRPSAGRRLLRLFVNINPTEPRVWITSEKFEALLARFRERHRVPARAAEEWLAPPTGLQRLLQGDWSGRPAYDAFMQKLQQFLRANETFQERAPKRVWHFPPGAAWMLLADGLSHAVLRGQFALEHSFFVPLEVLSLPRLSPLSQLVAAGQAQRLRRAG
jgi:hypothetical protein